MKKEEPDAGTRIASLATDISKEVEHWKVLKSQGCNDPFWSDGANMNLTRNHILSDKRQILDICGETGIPFPAEYYIPTPPEVDKDYMANLKQKERVERLRQFGRITTKKCPAYDSQQMSLF